MTPYYERDGIQIWLGDCRDILPRLDIDKSTLILTDPPYGIAYATNFMVGGVGASWIGESVANDDDTSVRDWMIHWAKGMPMCVFGSWKRPTPQQTRAVLVWDKGPASGMGDLSFPWKSSFELIYVIGDGFHGSRDEGVIKGLTMVTWESAGRCHPNAKPVSLMAYLIGKTEARTILDPFMGSGCTMIAAQIMGRKALGIEIEERYAEIAARRLSQAVLPLPAAPAPTQGRLT